VEDAFLSEQMHFNGMRNENKAAAFYRYIMILARDKGFFLSQGTK